MGKTTEKFSDFEEVISSLDEIYEIMGPPLPQVLSKVIDHLDDVCRSYIAASPFCQIATVHADGPIDISPKGDPAGFVQVLDDHHLAIPDRPGNRRVDTFRNLLCDPRVGLFFLVPGTGETLRISGEARIVRDQALRESMAVNGKAPAFAIVVHVERAFIHCPKCVARSKLWQPDAWAKHDDLPGIGAAMIAHGKLTESEPELDKIAEDGGYFDLC